MNAPLTPPRCRRRDTELCHEVRALTVRLGRAPSVAEVSRWAGFAPGIAGPRVRCLVRRALATLERTEVATPNGKRTCWAVTLTALGAHNAVSSSGIPGSPRVIVEPPTPRPAEPRPPRTRHEVRVERARENPRLMPGAVKGGRVLVCVIDDEVMSRCLACGFERAVKIMTWLEPRVVPCANCARCAHPMMAEWLADVPDVPGPTPEERFDLLDLFLEEVGRAPLRDGQRLDIALAYIAEHHPDHVCTLEQVAAVLGVTRERVRQIQAKAVTKLRARLSRDGQAAGIVEELRDLDITRHGED